MPDGKTFLEAGGVVDEIVDVRAEEASTFAGPFARRLSQRLIATRKTRSLACQSAVCSDGNRNGSKSATKEQSSSGCYGRPSFGSCRQKRPEDTAQTLIPTNICTLIIPCIDSVLRGVTRARDQRKSTLSQ